MYHCKRLQSGDPEEELRNVSEPYIYRVLPTTRSRAPTLPRPPPRVSLCLQSARPTPISSGRARAPCSRPAPAPLPAATSCHTGEAPRSRAPRPHADLTRPAPATVPAATTCHTGGAPRFPAPRRALHARLLTRARLSHPSTLNVLIARPALRRLATSPRPSDHAGGARARPARLLPRRLRTPLLRHKTAHFEEKHPDRLRLASRAPATARY